LQAIVSVNTGQLWPPFTGSVVTDRVREVVPAPQVLVQTLKSLHPVTMQSTLQGAVLQAWLSDKVGQATPPFWGRVEMVLKRCLVPLAQAAVHTPHADQLETTQSTLGPEEMTQVILLQDCVEIRDAQGRPPFEADNRTVLCLCLIPTLPQV
jgi:hypothetical protein